MNETNAPAETSKPRWQPVPAIERRILGVLVEKAKTVPESYPMTLAGICTACNQKNNRFPLMQLEQDQLDAPLERLRNLGAIALVQGSGRVEKFRHYLSDWLGVDKLELAVMTELLLRGAQTEGELRQRASRMEQILDLTTLRNVLHSLTAKNLVISLTSAGRGHVVTHNLYEPREMEKLRRDYEAQGPAATESDAAEEDEPATAASGKSEPSVKELVLSLQQDVEALRTQLQAMREEMAALRRT
jgi:uncharacterized protein YceH (UPF0502 family)